MKLGSAILCVTLFVASHAVALEEDTTSMNTPEKAAQYTDPDEKTSLPVLQMQGRGNANGETDTSAVRYRYDSAAGTYVPQAAPQAQPQTQQ